MNLIFRFLKQPVNKVNEKSTQQSLYGLTAGVNNLVVGVISTISTVLSDFFLISLMLLTLIFTDALMAMIAFVIFSTVAVMLHFLVGKKSKAIAEELIPSTISANEGIIYTIEGYRELFVANQIEKKIVEVEESMKRVSLLTSKQSFLPHVSKYLIEVILVFSLLSLSLIQFILSDAVESAGNLGLFLAASTRIAPAALRVQQSFSTIMNGFGGGKSSLELYRRLPNESQVHESKQPNLISHLKGKDARDKKQKVVDFEKVTFSYRNDKEILKNLNFQVCKGQRVLILGRSGSGKSTLIDLLLGLLDANEGSIELFGENPKLAIKSHQGRLAYVPQNPFLFKGSIRDNIVGPKNEISDEEVWSALSKVDLRKLIEKLPEKLNTMVSENGKNFSGGQRQRISLARALVLKPKLLILDEATSALDTETELKIMNRIAERKFVETLIVISHKVQNIKQYDLVGVLNRGNLDFGSVREISAKYPKLSAFKMS